MKLTKKRAIEEHRKMWNWIAEQYENETDILFELHNVERLKDYYIRLHFNELSDLEMTSNCFCCVYDDQYHYDCSNCPLEWESNDNYMPCIQMGDEPGLFEIVYVLTRSTFLKESIEFCGKIARKIANLPERNINERGEEI